MRIHVTGNAGAGKTTLARKLGEELNLPVVHLDGIVWREGWVTTPHDVRDSALSRLAEPATWLIEGVSSYIRDQADLVIYLDVPRHVCLWRCAKRNWRYLFSSRPELPPKCPEWLIVPQLLRIIWRFPTLVGSSMLAEAQFSPKYLILKDNPESDAWYEEFTSAQAA